jgi:hypothetical protein
MHSRRTKMPPVVQDAGSDGNNQQWRLARIG